jgi:hypothetical protein
MLLHIRKRLGELHRQFGPEPNEDGQLENPPAVSVRTAIRSALDFAQAGLEPIEAALLEIEKLAAGET